MDDEVEKLVNVIVTEYNRGVIDCLNSVNLLSYYSRQRDTPNLNLICQNNLIDNLIDSNRNYASNYLMDYKNFEGMNVLFNR